MRWPKVELNEFGDYLEHVECSVVFWKVHLRCVKHVRHHLPLLHVLCYFVMLEQPYMYLSMNICFKAEFAHSEKTKMSCKFKHYTFFIAVFVIFADLVCNNKKDWFSWGGGKISDWCEICKHFYMVSISLVHLNPYMAKSML